MSSLPQYFPITDPTLGFLVVLLIILFAPIIMGKLRIPHIIGMVIAGVLISQYGLNILERDASFELFGKVGLYYIMFLAALEMDMEGLKKNKYRMLTFGLLTSLIPFAITYFTGKDMLGYSVTASLLLGCIMASNTLVAYPIVGKYGLQRKPSVIVSVGSTMIALFLALVMLAIIVASNQGNSSWGFWIWFAVKFVAFCVVLIFFIPRLARWFLRRYSDAVMQFIFVLVMLFMSASLSEAIGLEGIFGAFLAGLILNRYIPHLSPLMNRIEFIGNAIFIPYFLIGVGMLINVRLLFQGGGIIWVVFCFVLFGTLGKALAAYVASLLLKMHRHHDSVHLHHLLARYGVCRPAHHPPRQGSGKRRITRKRRRENACAGEVSGICGTARKPCHPDEKPQAEPCSHRAECGLRRRKHEGEPGTGARTAG